MGKAAARVGDKTSHGSPLGGGSPGCSTVLIESQPAWRAGSDMHLCPLCDGPKPHVGGLVSKGSSSVFIGGLPAARQGDVISEAGPPNMIEAGAKNVMIGG